MVYVCQKVGDRSLENTEISNLYESLVVWRSRVYISGYSFQSYAHIAVILYPLPQRKKSDIWKAFLDFGINIYHIWIHGSDPFTADTKGQV